MSIGHGLAPPVQPPATGSPRPSPCGPAKIEAVHPRIMYIESKADGLTGPARIGRVKFSKTGRTLYYRGRSFRSLNGSGFKANYYDVETGDEYWISGPRKDGSDRLYGERVPVEIDVVYRGSLIVRRVRHGSHPTPGVRGLPSSRPPGRRRAGWATIPMHSQQ